MCLGGVAMRRPGVLLTVIVFLGVIAMASELVGCGSGGGSHPAQSAIPATVDQVVKAEMQRVGIPAVAVGFAKNGANIYVQSYGVTNLQTNQPAQTDTVFELASLTKQFTAALIMQLQQNGMLTVDDSAATYLPSFGFPHEITIRMLLNHTSGLADYTNFPAFQQWYLTGVSEATVLTAIQQAPLQFTPGTQYAYSNSNYFVLGSIIEAVTKQSYEANLTQHIIQPLAMTSTYYELPPAALAATGYSMVNSGTVAPPPASRSSLFAAGAISSDVGDMLVWDQALYSGTIVTPASFKEMTTPSPFTDQSGYSYGFGLDLGTYQGRPVALHTGYINGFLAYNVIFLDNGFNLVLLMNVDFDDQQALADKVFNAVCAPGKFPGVC